MWVVLQNYEHDWERIEHVFGPFDEATARFYAGLAPGRDAVEVERDRMVRMKKGGVMDTSTLISELTKIRNTVHLLATADTAAAQRDVLVRIDSILEKLRHEQAIATLEEFLEKVRVGGPGESTMLYATLRDLADKFEPF